MLFKRYFLSKISKKTQNTLYKKENLPVFQPNSECYSTLISPKESQVLILYPKSLF